MLRVLVVLTLHLQRPPGDGDRWIAPDKVKHFFTAAFVQSVSYATFRAAHAGHGAAIAGASAVTASISLGKEWWDARGHGTPSARDLVWDAAGAGAATLLLSHSVR